MSSTRIIKVIAYALCAAVLCMTMGLIFLPEVISAGWHLFHGNSVNFLVFEIRVPWGWRVFKENDSIDIHRMERWNNLPSDIVVKAIDVPTGSSIDREQWEKASTDVELESGRHLISGNNVKLDDEIGYCFTFADSRNPDRLAIDCDFPVHRLTVGYVGSKDRSSVLDSVIQHIRFNK